MKQKHNPKVTKAIRFVNEFLKGKDPEEYKEERWRDLVYLMRSKDFNHSTIEDRTKALENFKDQCDLFDALRLLKKKKKHLSSIIH